MSKEYLNHVDTLGRSWELYYDIDEPGPPMYYDGNIYPGDPGGIEFLYADLTLVSASGKTVKNLKIHSYEQVRDLMDQCPIDLYELTET